MPNIVITDPPNVISLWNENLFSVKYKKSLMSLPGLFQGGN